MPDGEDGEVRLTIVKPKKAKTPVAVGAGGAEGEVADDAPTDGVLDAYVLTDGVHDVHEEDSPES